MFLGYYELKNGQHSNKICQSVETSLKLWIEDSSRVTYNNRGLRRLEVNTILNVFSKLYKSLNLKII